MSSTDLITVRAAREKRGWNQSELAERTGLSQAAISRLEAGVVSNPGVDTVKALARALRVRVDRLVFGQRDEAMAS